MSNKPLLEVKGLNVILNGHEILRNLNFDVQEKDIIAIIGPNGAGKTVLFKTLLGLFPYQGQISWEKDIKVGYVPQKLSIDKELPLTVEEFFKLKNISDREMLESLEAVGIDVKDTVHLKHHILSRPLGRLSGGQFQRVLVAWAITGHPNILLFDEPTAGIDIGGEETIYNLLTQLHRKRNLTILLISHDLHVVYRYANKVVCLNKDMVCYGEPHSVLDPQSLAKLYGEAQFYKHQHE